MRSGGTISPHDGSNIYGAGKLKAQCVSSGKTIPIVLKATRISAVWFGVAAIALAAAAIDPALAGKKQKPAKAPDEPIVHVDTKEPMIVVVSIGQQKVDVYRGTTLVTTSAVSTGTSAHPTFIGAFSIMQKARWHHSNIYSNAPMPWMNRLTWSGTAMHAGIVPGYPASHGCIRLTYAFAPKFFADVIRRRQCDHLPRPAEADADRARSVIPALAAADPADGREGGFRFRRWSASACPSPQWPQLLQAQSFWRRRRCRPPSTARRITRSKRRAPLSRQHSRTKPPRRTPTAKRPAQ